MKIDAVFKALSDPTRLRVLRLVASMELAVGEIAQVLGHSQPSVSRHIAILGDAGLIERRREGSWIFLRAAKEEELAGAISGLLAACEGFDMEFGELCGADRRKLATIRNARESQAQDYFAVHASNWDELRRLHSPDEAVEDALNRALGPGSLGQVLDIGTGTGRMAELFAGRARRVVALDKSPAMLRVARARLQHLGGDKVEMVQGDFTDLPLADASMDTVLFHQVLHFAQNPVDALAEAARVLRSGGRIAIVDFAAHQREELREKYAHARLGFGDEQMGVMLRQAGFDPGAPQAMEEGELVVKIWLATRLPTEKAAA